MKPENELQDLFQILLDENTSSEKLAEIANAHELNPKCSRKCELCENFWDKTFELREELPSAWFYIGEAIAVHRNCDEKLSKKLQKWVDSHQDGEWSRRFQAAVIANPNIETEKLISIGIQTENSIELWEVKYHKKMNSNIEAMIFQGRGWKAWPDDDYLEENSYIFDDSEELEEIQID